MICTHCYCERASGYLEFELPADKKIRAFLFACERCCKPPYSWKTDADLLKFATLNQETPLALWFGDLFTLSPSLLERLLVAIPIEVLVLATKVSSASQVAEIRESLSPDRRKAFEDWNGYVGPVRVSEVEGAQAKVVEAMLRY